MLNDLGRIFKLLKKKCSWRENSGVDGAHLWQRLQPIEKASTAANSCWAAAVIHPTSHSHVCQKWHFILRHPTRTTAAAQALASGASN
jgi:hypothetical protein